MLIVELASIGRLGGRSTRRIRPNRLLTLALASRLSFAEAACSFHRRPRGEGTVRRRRSDSHIAHQCLGNITHPLCLCLLNIELKIDEKARNTDCSIRGTEHAAKLI